MADLRKIKIFIAIVEKGSFSAAARALDISAAAVSKQVSLLEEKCRQTLFDRTTRAMAITSFGKEYYQHCKKVISALDVADKFIELHSDQIQGSLRLHSPPYIAGMFLLPLLKKLMHQYPLLSVHLSMSDDVPNMLDQDIDLLVGYSSEAMMQQQNLHCCKLFESESVLAATPEYLNEHGMPADKDDLYKHRFIQLTHVPQPLAIQFLDGDVLENLNTALALGDRRLMCLAALQGMGILYTTKKSILMELVAGDLIELLPGSLAGKSDICAFYKPSATDSPSVRKCLNELIEVIKVRQAMMSNKSLLSKLGKEILGYKKK